MASIGARPRFRGLFPPRNEKEAWPKERIQHGFGLTSFDFNNACLDAVFETVTIRELYQAIGQIRPFMKNSDGIDPPPEPIVYSITNTRLDDWYQIQGYLHEQDCINAINTHCAEYLNANVDKPDVLRSHRNRISRFPKALFKLVEYYDSLRVNYVSQKERNTQLNNLRSRIFNPVSVPEAGILRFSS